MTSGHPGSARAATPETPRRHAIRRDCFLERIREGSIDRWHTVPDG